MLLWVPHLSNPMQIRKLIVSPEDWDGDIWGDPGDYDEGKDDPLFPSESSEYEDRCNIKAEYILIPVGPWGQLVKRLIDTAAQSSVLTQQDAEKLGV